MKEIEVKILEINKEEIIKKLEALGAKKIFEGEITTTYFINNDFKKEGKTLRLRKKEDKAILTFKNKSFDKDAKIRDEYETLVEDFEITKKIINELGYVEEKTHTKHRISYILSDVSFEIDKLPGIPTLLEIEGKTEELVDEYVEILGFSKEDVKPWTGGGVVNHYQSL